MNESKTKSDVFKAKRDKPFHPQNPQLILNNNIIEDVTVHKHLGLTLSSNLSWQAHILKKSSKSFQNIKLPKAHWNTIWAVIHVFDRDTSHRPLPIKCKEKLIPTTLRIIKYGFHSIFLLLFSSFKGIVLEKIPSMRCHSEAFLWDVYFGRHFISKHFQDDKQKRTREGIGKLYQPPQNDSTEVWNISNNF